MAEVEGVVMALDSSISAGPDGFNGTFFAKCWDIIKVDMLEAVEWFFDRFGLPKSISGTKIALIP